MTSAAEQEPRYARSLKQRVSSKSDGTFGFGGLNNVSPYASGNNRDKGVTLRRDWSPLGQICAVLKGI